MKRSGFQKPLMVVVVSAIAFSNFGFFNLNSAVGC
jgi:hypothetical protein